jgi:anti-anti-sigma factor
VRHSVGKAAAGRLRIHLSGTLSESTRHLCQGDHACLLYSSEREQGRAVLPFIRAGLDAGEKVLYVAEDERGEQMTDFFERSGSDLSAALAGDRLEVGIARDHYLRGGSFDAGRMIRDLSDAVIESREGGFAHLRIAGEMGWATTSSTDIREVIDYEDRVDALLRESGTAALCQYDRGRFELAAMREAERSHQLVLAERDAAGGAPSELLVERSAGGATVLRGEAEGHSAESLARSLEATIARGDDVRLDLSDLSYMGAASLRAIRDAAEVLETRGGRLTLVSPRPVVRHVVKLMGLPRSLVVEDAA